MLAVSRARLLAAGFTSFAPHMISGLDGMAFDQWTDHRQVLERVHRGADPADDRRRRAESRQGQLSSRALGEFARRGPWIGAAVVVLGDRSISGSALVQGFVRSAIWTFWQVSAASQFIKNLIYFVFIFWLRDAAALDHLADPDLRPEAVLHLRRLGALAVISRCRLFVEQAVDALGLGKSRDRKLAEIVPAAGADAGEAGRRHDGAAELGRRSSPAAPPD